MLDDLPDGLMRPVIQVLGATLRGVWYIFAEILGELVLWSIGWCFCRVISWGRYPKQGLTQAAEASVATELVVITAGLIVLVGSSFLVFSAIG